jgi:predicted acylesterase/phospholipase RssA
VTFEEAYEKTGRHVCIMVSAQNIGGSKAGPQRLLLNHISTPHVTLASAVAASCALPGIMDSQILEVRVDSRRANVAHVMDKNTHSIPDAAAALQSAAAAKR